MEFVSVDKSGVGVYVYSPGEPPSEPVYKFPPVRTAEGCVWSSDGMLLGLEDVETGGIAVHVASEEYARLVVVQPLIGGPIRNFYFSPLGTYIVTFERHAKDKSSNVGVWEAKTGTLLSSFVLKQLTVMSWPPVKWTSLETHCCRMVQDGVQVMPGNMQRAGADEEAGAGGKLQAAGIMAFEVAPKGAGTGPPHVAICIAESRGAPAKCQIFRLDSLEKPTATKTFFKAQTVRMQWNNTGTAVLVQTTMEVDDTGKSYYGGSHLYFLRPDGEESALVAAADDGPIHDVQWSPIQDEFCLLHGNMPTRMTVHDGRKGQQKVDFGTGHRNTIRWNNFGRFLMLGGHGNLIGDTDFWDKPGKKLLGSVRMDTCVMCSWAPDGRHFLGATTSPRMRVDNKIEMYDYCGRMLQTLRFEELLLACWRPMRRGAFEDRPPTPGRERPVEPKAGGASAPVKQAYRARGSGGLAETLRRELGSTAGDSTGVATKTGFAPPQRLPPGASAADLKAVTGPSTNSRNARKKKAKEKAALSAAAGDQENDEDEPGTPPAAPPAAPVPVEPNAKSAPSVQPGCESAETSVAAPPGDNAEVEKKVRALRKKLRDIEKLKEKPAQSLDVLQREKIAGELAIIKQIQELGFQP